MSTIIARQLVQRLRSNGVKVTLRPRPGYPGEVQFSSLDNVPADLRAKLAEHGRFIRQQLEEEAQVRAARARAKGVPKEPRSRIKDVPIDQL